MIRTRRRGDALRLFGDNLTRVISCPLSRARGVAGGRSLVLPSLAPRINRPCARSRAALAAPLASLRHPRSRWRRRSTTDAWRRQPDAMMRQGAAKLPSGVAATVTQYHDFMKRGDLPHARLDLRPIL